MAIKISFDITHNPEPPTIVLAKRNGDRLGVLEAKSIDISDGNVPEISFNVYKYLDNVKCNLWEQIVDFKLIYCVEWDMFFEITVETDEKDETIKTISGTHLGVAELSQTVLYNVEINTENDIERDDYGIPTDEEVIPTVLYNPDHPEISLLHRINEKVPHYEIIHVDDSIKNIPKTFTFNDTSIFDSYQKISEEIGCIFEITTDCDENRNIQRKISVYDLESNCRECGYRGEFTGACPKCGSTDINEGYGADTTIFVTADELADNIQLSTNTSEVKNCFKLVAGDDLMTATIRNCNPNGTDYIWYISDSMKQDMSEELIERLNEYDERYNHYKNDCDYNFNSMVISNYNALIRKYKKYNSGLEEIQTPIKGYGSLMGAYYDTIDFEHYLRSSLMPIVEISGTNAESEISKLNSNSLSSVAVTDLENISEATADSAVLSMAKVIIDSRYKVSINNSTLTKLNGKGNWVGRFYIENYSDETDCAESPTITITITDDYSSFVQQKIEKTLNKGNNDDLSITGLFKKSISEFKDELEKYSLNYLNIFYNSAQSCIDILIGQGVGNKETWSGENPSLYDDLYIPYLEKLSAIEAEIALRQSEIDTIVGVYDENNQIKTYGVQTYVENWISAVQNELNFQNYIGKDLWAEFISFRREDKYSNDNYISDGLNNAELINKALEFIEVAEKEIYKSSELQHTISATLKNLLVMPKFKPLVDNFKIGNWLRVSIDDEIYKLRLTKYSLKFDDLSNIQVEFSDVVKNKSSIKSIQDLLSQTKSMATSYNAVQKQAEQGEKSNTILKDWTSKGLDTTNTKIIGGADNQTQTWDEHGMLFKEYDSITDSYDDIQLKIINSTIAITDDNWETAKTAVGAYYYYHPVTKKLTRAYGVNGEVVIGKLLLGEQLGIYNEDNSLTFDDKGLVVTNGTNSFKVSPNEEKLLTISNATKDVFYVDRNGLLHISGDGSGLTLDSGSVQIAWNEISKYIQFKNGELQIYNDDNIVSKFNNSGSYFYEDGMFIGKIGTNRFDDINRGLVFDLEAEGQYMAWAAKDYADANAYNVKLLYYHYYDDDSNSDGRLYKDGLHLRCNFYVGNKLRLDDDISTIVYNNIDGSVIGGGLHSNEKIVFIESGNSSFECRSNKFVFNHSTASLIDCYNNIDMHNYSILNQSDERLKCNIKDVDISALDLLNQIKLKEFDWIENNSHEPIGIIAQQLLTIMPDLVHEDSDTGKLSIKMIKFIPYLLKAVQELYALNYTDTSTFNLKQSNRTIQEDDIDINSKIEFVNSLKSNINKYKKPKIVEPITIPINK